MKNYDANIIALASLRLKDDDLSKLSDQELFDKYCKTCDRFMEMKDKNPNTSDNGAQVFKRPM